MLVWWCRGHRSWWAPGTWEWHRLETVKRSTPPRWRWQGLLMPACIGERLLADDLANYYGRLGGLWGVLVYVGCEPWGSRGPRPPSIWKIVIRTLVVGVIQGTSIPVGSTDPLAWTCLGYITFHSQPVCAALGDCEGSRSIPWRRRFLPVVPKTVFWHGIFFRYNHFLQKFQLKLLN